MSTKPHAVSTAWQMDQAHTKTGWDLSTSADSLLISNSSSSIRVIITALDILGRQHTIQCIDATPAQRLVGLIAGKAHHALIAFCLDPA